MSKGIDVTRQTLSWLFPLLVLALSNRSNALASTINVSGSVTGTASVDLADRCAPFPTMSASGAGVATGLGNFVDTQSHCTNGNFSFNQGIFDLTSTDIPGSSLFGTYSGTASVQNGLLDFTSTLLVTGGTGLFSNDSGALLSSGVLDENTGAFSASFSGAVGTVPEPSTGYFMVGAIAAASLIRLRRNRLKPPAR